MGEREGGNDDEEHGRRGGTANNPAGQSPGGAETTTTTTTTPPHHHQHHCQRRRSPRGGQKRSPRRRVGMGGDDNDGVTKVPVGGALGGERRVDDGTSGDGNASSSSVSWTKTLINSFPNLSSSPSRRRSSPRRSSAAATAGSIDTTGSLPAGAGAEGGGKDDDAVVVADDDRRGHSVEEEDPDVEDERTNHHPSTIIGGEHVIEPAVTLTEQTHSPTTTETDNIKNSVEMAVPDGGVGEGEGAGDGDAEDSRPSVSFILEAESESAEPVPEPEPDPGARAVPFTRQDDAPEEASEGYSGAAGSGGGHGLNSDDANGRRRLPRGGEEEDAAAGMTTTAAVVGLPVPPPADGHDSFSAAAATAAVPTPSKSVRKDDVFVGRVEGSEEDGGQPAGGAATEQSGTSGAIAKAKKSATPVSFVEDMEECEAFSTIPALNAVTSSPSPKRGRGRPKGSKNRDRMPFTPVVRSRSGSRSTRTSPSPRSTSAALSRGAGEPVARTGRRTPGKRLIESDEDETFAPSRRDEEGKRRSVVYAGAGANGRRGNADDDSAAGLAGAMIATRRRGGGVLRKKGRGRGRPDAYSTLSDDGDGAGVGSTHDDADGHRDETPRCEGVCCRILRGRRLPLSDGSYPTDDRLRHSATSRRAKHPTKDENKNRNGRCFQCGHLFPRAWRMVSEAERLLETSAMIRDTFLANLDGSGVVLASSSSRPSDGDEDGVGISTRTLTLKGLERALDPMVRDLPSWSMSSTEEADTSSKRVEARTMALRHISETLCLSLEAEAEATARRNGNDDGLEGKAGEHGSDNHLPVASDRSQLEFINLLRGNGDGNIKVVQFCDCVPRKKVGFGPADDLETGPQDAKGGRCCDRCRRLKRAPPRPHPHPQDVGDAPHSCRACGGDRGLLPLPTTASGAGGVLVVCGSCRLLSLATRNSLRRRLAAAAEGAGVSISPSDFEEEEEEEDCPGGGERDGTSASATDDLVLVMKNNVVEPLRSSTASRNETGSAGGEKKRKFSTRRNAGASDAGIPVSKRRTRGGDGKADGDNDPESGSGMDDDAKPLSSLERRRSSTRRRSSSADERRPAKTRPSNKATTRRKGGRPSQQRPKKRSLASREGTSSSRKLRRSLKNPSSGEEESPDECSHSRTRARPPRRTSTVSFFVGKRNGRRVNNRKRSKECSSSSSDSSSTSSSDDDEDDDESFVEKSTSRRTSRGRGNRCSGDGATVEKDGDGATSGGAGASSSCLRFRDNAASKRNALQRAGRPQVEALSRLLDDLPREMSRDLLLPTTAYAEDGTKHGRSKSGKKTSRVAESKAPGGRDMDELRIISRIVQARHAAGDYEGARRLCESALNDFASRARALLISADGLSSRGGGAADATGRHEHVDGISCSQQRPSSVASASMNGDGSAGHTLPDERYVVQREMQRIVSGLWCLLASLVEHCPSSLHSSLVDGSGSEFVDKRRRVEQIHELSTRCDVASTGSAVWIAHGRFLAEEDVTHNDNVECITGDGDTPGGKNGDVGDSAAGALNSRATDVLRNSLRASALAVEKEMPANPLIKSLTERASICNDLNLHLSATSHRRGRGNFTDHFNVNPRNPAATDEREGGEPVGTSSFVRSLQLVCPSCRQQLESHEALREHSFGCSLSESGCDPNNAFGSTSGNTGPFVDIIVASTSASTGQKSAKRNRVCIRCRSCHVASGSDGSGKTNIASTSPHITYPKSTSRLWEDVRRMYNDHLTSCPHVQLDPNCEGFGIDDDGSTSEFRWYWDAISRRLGFVAVTDESTRQDSLRGEYGSRTTGELREKDDGFGTKARVAACAGNSCSKRTCVDKAGDFGRKRKWNWAADCGNLVVEHADGRIEMPSVPSDRSKARPEGKVLANRPNTDDYNLLNESDEIPAGRSVDALRPRMGLGLIVESASPYWHDTRKAARTSTIPADVGREFFAQQLKAVPNAEGRELSMSPDAIRCRERRRRTMEESKRAVHEGVEKRTEGGLVRSVESAGISNVGDESDSARGGGNHTLVDYDRDIEIATEYLLALHTHFVPCRTRPTEAEPHGNSRMYLCCKHCQKVVPARGIQVNFHRQAVKYLKDHLVDECSEVDATSRADIVELQGRRDRSADSASFFQRVSERYCSAVSVTTTENRSQVTDGILAHPSSTAAQGPSTDPSFRTCDANKANIEEESLPIGQHVGEHRNDDLVEMSTCVNSMHVGGTTPPADFSQFDSGLASSTKKFGLTFSGGYTSYSGKGDSFGQPETRARLSEENPGAGISAGSSLVGKSACSLKDFREAGMVSTSNLKSPDPATILPLKV